MKNLQAEIDQEKREKFFGNMHESREALSKKVWDLHRRIGQPYNYSDEAWKDMVKLGEMAQGLIDLQNANATIRKHL